MSSIILEAKSLTKEYKQTLALDHINLQIKKGKIYGFIGLMLMFVYILWLKTLLLK